MKLLTNGQVTALFGRLLGIEQNLASIDELRHGETALVLTIQRLEVARDQALQFIKEAREILLQAEDLRVDLSR